MARKSRRTNNETEDRLMAELPEDVNLPENQIATAAYARLSVDKGDDESLETQIRMLHQYINEQPELTLADTYIDNGYTGTDFNRPEFIRLMDDVRKGRIHCIVVKDLSRFGRDFLETGYYLETLFPHLNVRFISINDDFDSSRESDQNSIAVPMKNIVNEMYAKEFSKKATAYYELHSKRGDKKIELSTFGYSLDKEKNMLVVNPDTAPYVQVIFRWFLMGYRIHDIVVRLNLLNVITPYAYKAMYEEGKPVPDTDRWTKDRVKTILRNQTYAGDTVYGKRRKIFYKNIDVYHAKKEDWIIHENTHEALIARDDFNEVQERLDDVGRKRKDRLTALKDHRESFTDYFPQKVCCMECGNTMFYSRYTRKRYCDELDGACYICKGNDIDPGCGQKIHEDYLKIVVMDQIRNLINTLCDRKKLLKKLQDDDCSQGALAAAKRKISDLKAKLYRSEETSDTLYENLVNSILTQEEYQLMKEHYIMEQQNLREEIAKAEQNEREIEQKIERSIDLVDHLEQYIGKTELDTKLIDELVDKILVSSNGDIEIQFSCDDVLKEIPELLQEGEEE